MRLPPGQTICGDICVDLSSDAAHCGSCTQTCLSTQTCSDGVCLSSPCDGLCATPETVPLGADGFRVEPLGAASRCLEVRGYAPTLTDPRVRVLGIREPAQPHGQRHSDILCLRQGRRGEQAPWWRLLPAGERRQG